MIARILAAGCFLLAATAAEEAPDALPVAMAKALVEGDRKAFEALCATKEEMLDLLKGRDSPSAEELQEMEAKVDGILAERDAQFAEFQDLRRKAGIEDGDKVRCELVDMDKVHEKEGRKKIRHSRVRIVQTREGKEKAFLVGLDDLYLFKRGWAFTTVFITPRIVPEPPAKP